MIIRFPRIVSKPGDIAQIVEFTGQVLDENRVPRDMKEMAKVILEESNLPIKPRTYCCHTNNCYLNKNHMRLLLIYEVRRSSFLLSICGIATLSCSLLITGFHLDP